jgi:hypothetical protein
LFLAAQQKATFQAYQAFVHDFPGHRRANDAKKEMRRLGKAIVQVAYDHSVRGQPPGSGSDSGYNLGNEKPNTQHYEFNITFSETGGRSGYTLELTDFHIIDENGNQWGDGRTDTLTVKPGDKFVYNYWCNVEFTSATYHATWDGQDDVGNPIHCEQSIRMIRKR